eukprot:NODE_274_length_10990_cov_0.767606.p4 type:complete len:299 gc:universal NODE_274_length_10990_cov_0.767606:7686-8582(+)
MMILFINMFAFLPIPEDIKSQIRSFLFPPPRINIYCRKNTLPFQSREGNMDLMKWTKLVLDGNGESVELDGYKLQYFGLNEAEKKTLEEEENRKTLEYLESIGLTEAHLPHLKKKKDYVYHKLLITKNGITKIVWIVPYVEHDSKRVDERYPWAALSGYQTFEDASHFLNSCGRANIAFPIGNDREEYECFSRIIFKYSIQCSRDCNLFNRCFKSQQLKMQISMNTIAKRSGINDLFRMYGTYISDDQFKVKLSQSMESPNYSQIIKVHLNGTMEMEPFEIIYSTDDRKQVAMTCSLG